MPISEKLSAVNDNCPFTVYCLYESNDALYYFVQEDMIVVLRRGKIPFILMIY
ncbi:MAG: hypothetical protein WCQ54_12470 [Clostridiaceae bacterium]